MRTSNRAWGGVAALLACSLGAASAQGAQGAAAAQGGAGLRGAAGAQGGAGVQGGDVPGEHCGALTAVRLAQVTVTAAEVVAAAPATTWAYCRVQGSLRPRADSDIRFELWIPLGDAWNGKFEQVGNGGFAGVLPVRDMAHPLALGYAVAGTDDGHRSPNVMDASWALGHEERVKDYGYRAIGATTRAAQRLLTIFKSQAARRAYFVGCSDGGREALMMAQRFPRYFDGIVAGAPAYTMTRLLTGGALHVAALEAPAGHLGSGQRALLQSFVLKSCGDGAHYLHDPRGCHPDLGALRCGPGQTETCLTEAQIGTAQTIYRQTVDPATHAPLYAVLPGAEAVRGSWDAWLTGTDAGGEAAAVTFAHGYVANMIVPETREAGQPGQVTTADIVRAARRYAPLMDAGDPDLSAFKAHGGKLIQYHGWNDPAIPPGYSLEYRARVLARMGSVAEFYRLYMVPGMLHCGGGDAPTGVDWQAAIEAWVERAEAPGALTASDGHGGAQTLLPYAGGDPVPRATP